MAVDVRTLIGAASLVWLLSSVCLLFVWFTRKTYPGFGSWTLQSILLTLGLLLSALRGLVPGLLSILGGNSLILLAIVMAVRGIKLFFGRDMPRAYWAALALAVGALLWFTHVVPDMEARTVLVSGFAGVVTMMLAVELFRRAGSEALSSARFVGVVLAGYSLMALHRVATAMQSGPLPQFLEPSLSQVGYFLATLSLGLLGAFGFIMMNAQRLEQELTVARDHLQSSLDVATRKTAEVRVLSGLLNICASCKRIRDDAGGWNNLEVYIRDRSQAEFSHAICPTCAAALYPEHDAPDAFSSGGTRGGNPGSPARKPASQEGRAAR